MFVYLHKRIALNCMRMCVLRSAWKEYASIDKPNRCQNISPHNTHENGEIYGFERLPEFIIHSHGSRNNILSVHMHITQLCIYNILPKTARHENCPWWCIVTNFPFASITPYNTYTYTKNEKISSATRLLTARKTIYLLYFALLRVCGISQQFSAVSINFNIVLQVNEERRAEQGRLLLKRAFEWFPFAILELPRSWVDFWLVTTVQCYVTHCRTQYGFVEAIE